MLHNSYRKAHFWHLKNKAVYTALVAPSRPKSESVTDRPTNQPTNGRTDTRSYRVASSRLKMMKMDDILTRPIRPTMRPRDDEIIV